jgi:hypothetical protein
MGIIKGGILGGFTNKTGAVIGAYWRTLHTMRGLPRKGGKQPLNNNWISNPNSVLL